MSVDQVSTEPLWESTIGTICNPHKNVSFSSQSELHFHHRQCSWMQAELTRLRGSPSSCSSSWEKINPFFFGHEKLQHLLIDTVKYTGLLLPYLELTVNLFLCPICIYCHFFCNPLFLSLSCLRKKLLATTKKRWKKNRRVVKCYISALYDKNRYNRGDQPPKSFWLESQQR